MHQSYHRNIGDPSIHVLLHRTEMCGMSPGNALDVVRNIDEDRAGGTAVRLGHGGHLVAVLSRRPNVAANGRCIVWDDGVASAHAVCGHGAIQG